MQEINRDITQMVEYLLGYVVNQIESDYYISKAVVIVKNYLNDDKLTDEIILSKHKNAIIELVYRTFNTKKNKSEGIKSITQGQRSVTYSDNASNPMLIDDDIKALLPPPKVRVL